MGEWEDGSDASGNGPAVFGGKPPAGDAGEKPASGADPPGGGLEFTAARTIFELEMGL